MRGRAAQAPADDSESPTCAFSPPTSFQRFTDCYKRFYQLQPEMTQRIYDKFVTQLQTSIQVSGKNARRHSRFGSCLPSRQPPEGRDPALGLRLPSVPRTIPCAQGLQWPPSLPSK